MMFRKLFTAMIVVALLIAVAEQVSSMVENDAFACDIQDPSCVP